MKFRTPITIQPLSARIDYRSSILTIGSCFAQNIASRFSEAKFDVCVNPTGVLFNPISIADALSRFDKKAEIGASDLGCSDGLYFNFDFHGSFNNNSLSDALCSMQRGVDVGCEALQRADVVVITFGSSWVFEHEGRVVANCHKQPSREFVRRLLTVEEIVERYSELLGGVLRDKRVILTISPVRYLADGLEGSSLSKALLRVAVQELCAKFSNVEYFGSFEILMDDLRDYRFYDVDMVHPTAQAVEYVWQKFVEATMDDAVQQQLAVVQKIMSARSHIPYNPQSEGYRKFCKAQIAAIDKVEGVDFSQERAFFDSFLGIND